LGARAGWKASPRPLFWIQLNSLMNGAGRVGSKWGHNAGIIGSCNWRASGPRMCVAFDSIACTAMLYSAIESTLDNYNVDRYFGNQAAAAPVLAGACTGLLYKSTGEGPRGVGGFASK
jgi:hypothetical protein